MTARTRSRWNPGIELSWSPAKGEVVVRIAPPPPADSCSPNAASGRHWSRRAVMASAVKRGMRGVAYAPVAKGGRWKIRATWEGCRIRDDDNRKAALLAVVKPALDAFVDAGFAEEDDASRVTVESMWFPRSPLPSIEIKFVKARKLDHGLIKRSG